MSLWEDNNSEDEDELLNEILKEEDDQTSPKHETNKEIEDLITKPIAGRKRKISEPVNMKSDNELLHTLFGNKEVLLLKLSKSDEHAVTTSSKAAKPVWNDPDDEELHCDDVIDYEKKGAPIVRKQGKYKAYLENTFSNVLGAPAWADLNHEREIDSDDEVLQTVDRVVKRTSAKLQSKTLQFKRMKDLNRATYSEGPGISAVEFHSTSSAAIVTGYAGLATFYSIDGRQNDKLHSLAFKNYSIKSCRIHKSGTEAIFGGTKKFIYCYDLLAGTTQRIFLPKNLTKMSHFEISPCGKLIGVIGRFGEVHLLSYSTKELLCTFKQEHPSSSLAFSMDSKQLLSHSVDAEISIFDIRSQKTQHRFYDEGCVNGSSITISPNGRLLAAGSNQGVVNVYDFNDVTPSTNPKPLKTVYNLTTGVSATTFNHTSEILAIGSKHISDAVKLVHFPSGTVYSNFPGMQANIGKPNVLSFSPNSGYFAIGNSAKEVTLYRLKYFSNY